MTNSIEDMIVSAAHAKGFQINSATMSVVACDLAGSKMVGDLISIPGKGSISVGSYLADLRSRAPSGFIRLPQPGQPDEEWTVSQMRRRRPAITANHISRYGGITHAHMTELAAARSAK